MTDSTQMPPQSNPLLDKVRLPGETFTLPSRGLFYNNGELDDSVNNGEIYMFPMVTLDEIAFKTPDKLYSGTAITEVITRCVPSVKKPLELLTKDIDFILVCLRRLSYGDTISITSTHTCEGAKEHDYDVSMTQFVNNNKPLDPTVVGEKFTMTMENGQVVKLSPPRFKDVLKFYQIAASNNDDADKLNDELNTSLFESIAGLIESVDGTTNKQHITEWAQAVPVMYVRRINEKIDELSDWGPTFDTELKCKDCGKAFTVNTPINPLAFFI